MAIHICDVCQARLQPRAGISLHDEGLTVTHDGRSTQLGPARYEIVAALVTAYPRPLSLGVLFDAIHFRTPDGKRPENEANLVRVLLHHTRAQIVSIGLDIKRTGRAMYSLTILP